MPEAVRSSSAQRGEPGRFGRSRVGRGRGETVNRSGVLATSGVGSSTSAVEVHLEHREHPGVRFTVALDADHEVCGVAIGVLRWRTRDYGGASVPEVDTSPAAGIKLGAADLRAVNWGQPPTGGAAGGT